MLLRITTTHRPATDLGYLLAKHPERVQSFSLNTGRAHVFFPERDEDRCSAVLLLEVDPIELVRKRGGRDGRKEAFPLRQYVNDRPYAASSLFSSAILQVFRTGLNGRNKERPELAQTPIPLELEIPTVPSRDGTALLHQLFEPLGYEVEATPIPLDREHPEWGEGRYCHLHLRATVKLSDALSHLYVLLPVLDNDKHYWIDQNEVEKLMTHGEGWLADHPSAELITSRYLLRKRSLLEEMRARLQEEEENDAEEVTEEVPRLHEERLARVAELIVAENPSRVIDLGCGEGRLLEKVVRGSAIPEITGVDVSSSALRRAERRFERTPEMMRNRITLLHGSLTYRDSRYNGYDVAALVEVIEHIDEGRLPAFEQVLFGEAAPGVIFLTTPNRDYNVVWDELSAGDARHEDHRFEWSREEFRSWCERVAEEHGYSVMIEPLGPASSEHPDAGSPTQMGVFRRCR